MMVSNCRVIPVQFRLTSALSNSITPGVATDHQSPKRGEMQVRQNPLRPSLLAESSMGKKTECTQPSLQPAWPTWEARGHSQKTAQDREPGYVKKTWKASHRNPADSATLQATPNDSMERDNPCRLSPYGEQVSTGGLHGEGFFKKPRPKGKPGDMLT